MLSRQAQQRHRATGLPAGRDDAFAAREQLSRELEAEAAVGAGDEGVGHSKAGNGGSGLGMVRAYAQAGQAQVDMTIVRCAAPCGQLACKSLARA
jgi:hypothetical protein